MPQRLRTHQDEEFINKDGANIIEPIKKENKIKLEQLFNYGRWKRPLTLRHLAFCLYLPIGAAIWPVRLVAIIVLFLILLIVPKSMTSGPQHLIRILMGIRTKFRGLEHLPKKGDKNAPRVIVCNHLSDFDPYPLFSVLKGGYHVMVAAHIKNVPIVGKVYEKFNTIYVDQGNKTKARTDVSDSLSKTELPLLIYPEGGLNNGKSGLMMFHKFVFGLGHSVLPIAMRMNNPWPVEVDYLGSSWFKNFFWWILVPYHNFELDFLQPVSINENETDADFASRVQHIIANHLNLEATTYTYAQKKELAKKLFSPKN